MDSTTLLSEAIAKMKKKPEVFIVASAIGWYGDRGDEELTEESEIGEGFLPETCSDWEDASANLPDEVRHVYLRSGIVLSGTGGALGKKVRKFSQTGS